MFRVLLLHKGNKRFTNIATQGPEFFWIRRTHQSANLHRGLFCVSHHQCFLALVPSRMRLDVSIKLLPQLFNRHMIVKVQIYRAQNPLRLPRPVFKRLFQKMSYRHDHAPLIPELDYNIRKRYFLDLPELPFDHDDVIKKDRLSQRQLKASEQVSKRPLNRNPCEDCKNPGGSEQTGSNVPQRGAEDQCCRQRDENNHAKDCPSQG